jgi:hypothetical protein
MLRIEAPLQFPNEARAAPRELRLGAIGFRRLWRPMTSCRATRERRFGETYVTAPANDFWRKRSKDCANDFWKRSKDFWKKPAKEQEPTVAKPETQEDRDYLTMMYEEHAEHARQHEVLRAAASGFFLALIAGLLAATVGGSNTGNKDRIIGSIICGLSILGASSTPSIMKGTDCTSIF